MLVAQGSFPDLDVERNRLGETVHLRQADIASPERLVELTRDVDALIVTRQPLRADHVAALDERVRVIGRAGIGVDSLDLRSLGARGIAVVHQPDYATAEVATHAVAMLLALSRRLVDADRIARRDWPTWRQVLGPIRAIEDSTVGVVGCGRIGRAAVERLRPFAKAVVAFDPLAVEPPEGAQMAQRLEDLFAASDAVTLHLPLTRETQHLVDDAALALMRPEALLVNVSRGGLVDEYAVARALRSGRLGGYACDAFDVEPVPKDSVLLTTPRTLLSPHMAWYSEASAVRLRQRTFDGVLEYLRGQSVVTGRLLPGLRRRPCVRSR